MRKWERMVWRPELRELASADRVARGGRIMRKASLENLLHARPQKSAEESWAIQQLVWQWWNSREPSGHRGAASEAGSALRGGRACQGRQAHHGGQAAPVIDRRYSGTALQPRGGRWGWKRVARLLRVDKSWVRELTERFEREPERWRRRFAGWGPATIEKLERAREETKRQRERGWLRPEAKWHRAAYVWEGKKRKAIVPSRAAQRRELEAAGRDFKGQRARAASVLADPRRLAWDELPLWARGVEFEPLPRMEPRSGTWMPPEPARRIAPVRFARRRRF